jgi:CheY-like chemotaxis protein
LGDPCNNNGRQILREIKADENLRPIPVIVLTHRGRGGCACRFRPEGNFHIQKPVGFDRFIVLMQAVYDFWLWDGGTSGGMKKSACFSKLPAN